MIADSCKYFWLLLALGLFACADTGTIEPAEGLTSLRLTLEGEAGAPGKRLDISDGLPVALKVEALDEQGRVIPDYEGELVFRAHPGYLSPNGHHEKSVRGGETVNLTLKRGFGRLRIRAEDKDRLVVGVSRTLYLPEPTLALLQIPAEIESGMEDIYLDHSPWVNTYVQVTAGRMVVTNTTADGFYASDIEQPEFGHIYAYTYGVPSVDRGDVLSMISGIVKEFYGLTELSFPDYDILCSFHPLPEPVELTREIITDDRLMEAHESALVSVRGIKSWKVDSRQYFEYGQWAGMTEDQAVITILSRAALPDFDPRQFKAEGGRFERIVGNLRQHYSADPEWIVVLRDECDVWGYGDRPGYCDDLMPESSCGDLEPLP